MADTQIDELRLDITVEDKTSGESSDKKVKNLATAISRLNKNLQAFDNAKFTKVFDNMSKGLDPFVKKIEKVSNALASLATIVSKGGLDKAVKEVTGKVPELKTETISDSGRKPEPIQAVQGQAEELQETTNKAKSLGSSILGITNKADILRKKLEMINAEMQKSGLSEKQLVQLKSQQLSIQEQIAKAEGKKPKVPLSNLLKSFGRIAMYRAVRRTIQEITQAFMESIDGIARYNSEFRDTMGSLQSSLAKVKASMGVAFYQVLILIEPLITQIANGITNLANSLSKVIANLRGVANYTKINTDYMKQYKSAVQGTLLSFDTFTTLSSNQQYDPSEMFKEGQDALDEGKFTSIEKALKNIFEMTKSILDIVKSLFDALSPLINSIIETLLPAITDLVEPIFEIVGVIVQGLSPALSSIIKFVAGVVKQIGGALKIISGFIKLLTGDFEGAWNTIGEGFANMVNGIANMFIGLAKFIIDALNLLFVKSNPLFWLLKAFGIDVGKQISDWNANWSSQAWNPIKSYANGGVYSSADMFYANENGKTELIASSNSSGGAVMNLDQWQQISEMSFYNALVKYGACQNGQTLSIDMNKLGTAVASNVGFRNEANRRNAGLNWK